MRKKNSFAWNVLVVLLILVALFYISNYSIKVTQSVIINNKIPEEFNGYKIVQLSDFHSMDFGKSNKKLINKIDEQKPDIVVMTGDMVSTEDKDYSIFYNVVDVLSKKYTLYYILGNHEQNINEERRNEIIDYLKNDNVIVLDNEKCTLEKDGTSIDMYGMWFNLRYYRDLKDNYSKDYYFDCESMKKIFDSPDISRFSLLLTHNPVYAETYSQWGADAVLTGHLHGGMIYVPFVGGLFSPENEWFPKYYGGMYKIDDMDLVVNKGLGSGNMGFRLFNRPEITVIKLYNE